MKEVQTSDKNRTKALEVAITQIEKQFGKGSIMRLGSEGVVEIPAISTGSIGLDVALGVGGFPRGRVVEIYGPESSGKTTLALNAVAQAQKAGGTAAFIDAEHALDVSYAGKIGVNINDLLISQPDTAISHRELQCHLILIFFYQFGGNHDFSGFGELDGVIGQIDEHLSQTQGIAL